MTRYINDRFRFQRAVNRALGFVHFRSEAAISERYLLEELLSTAGPYSLPDAARWPRRLGIGWLNRIFWRQHQWNEQMAKLLSVRSDSGGVTPSPRKPHLLIVVPNDVSEKWSGGSSRMWGLSRALSANFRVTLLTVVRSTRKWERRKIFNDVDLLLCPLSPALSREGARCRTRFGRAAWLLSMGDPATPFPLFDAYLRHASSTCAGILMVGPYLYERLRVHSPQVPLVYDMHDINADYVGRMAGEHREAAVADLVRIENRMMNDVRLVVCVSRRDERAIQEHYAVLRDKTHVAANGVFVAEAARCFPSESLRLSRNERVDRPVILFMGTMLGANQVAAQFIREHLAPAIPDALWVVMGSAGPAHLSRQQARNLPENLVFTGALSEAEKEAVFCLSHLAIAPMGEGTGSSLKIPDYIAHGKPVISTPVGMRGFESLTDHVRIAELDTFKEAIHEQLETLRTQPEALDRQANDAWSIVRDTLDWSVIARDLFVHMKRALGDDPGAGPAG